MNLLLDGKESLPMWPLAATPCTDAHKVRQGAAIVVNRVFEVGTLTMALNAGAGAADIPCSINGAPISTGIYNQQGDFLHLGDRLTA